MAIISAEKNLNFTQKCAYFIRGLGPGILSAAAAIGASHLVASTKSGAVFGWQLAWVILAVNLLKYPFLVAGTRYTLSTGESLIKGYKNKGKPYLILFGVLNSIAAVASTAGVSMLTGAILSFYIPMSVTSLVTIVLLVTLAIILLGHYVFMDRLTKVVMLILTISTIIAVILAFGLPSQIHAGFVEPNPYKVAYIGFMVAMMGWMPAPVEISTWNSMWLLEKLKTEQLSKQQILFDFNLGYIVTAILAVVFLALGALTMYGTGTVFPSSGVKFSILLMNMYGHVFGHFGEVLIGIVAFFCIFTTTITVVDGYSRALEETCVQLFDVPHSDKRFSIFAIVISALSLCLIIKFTGALLPLLNFVMTLAFLTTIIFAWLNYSLMTSTHIKEEDRYGIKMKILALAGFIYLILFLGLFIYYKLAL